VWRVLYPLFRNPSLDALSLDDSWYLAVELVFWIMDFVQPDDRRGVLATHPSPVARLVNVQEVTAAVEWVQTMGGNSSSLVPWIVRNRFSSPILTDPLYGDVERAKPELIENARLLRALEPLLERYRRWQHPSSA
jgi:hypothetical protein